MLLNRKSTIAITSLKVSFSKDQTNSSIMCFHNGQPFSKTVLRKNIWPFFIKIIGKPFWNVKFQKNIFFFESDFSNIIFFTFEDFSFKGKSTKTQCIFKNQKIQFSRKKIENFDFRFFFLDAKFCVESISDGFRMIWAL